MRQIKYYLGESLYWRLNGQYNGQLYDPPYRQLSWQLYLQLNEHLNVQLTRHLIDQLREATGEYRNETN